LKDSRLTTDCWLFVSLERLILDLELVREYAETETRLLRVLFLHFFLQSVALASELSVVYQEIKITKQYKNVSCFQRSVQ
jgi:hypothetical protein